MKIFQIGFEDGSDDTYFCERHLSYLLGNATGKKVVVHELTIPVEKKPEALPESIPEKKEAIKNVKKNKFLPNTEK